MRRIERVDNRSFYEEGVRIIVEVQGKHLITQLFIFAFTWHILLEIKRTGNVLRVEKK